MKIIKRFLLRIYYFFKNSVWYTLTFISLLILYSVATVLKWLGKFIPNKITSAIEPFFKKVYLVVLRLNSDSSSKNTISRINIIEIAIKNMNFKKSRSIITVGGMAVGICAIVFLVSLGYGIQELVISRVARLEEMKQANVSAQANSNVKINDKALAGFSEIDKVKKALPVIAVAGKVNFNNSVTDMVAYGVTTDYLEHSAIKPTQGKIFESYDLVNSQPESSLEESIGYDYDNKEELENEQSVASDDEINFAIEEGAWIRVRKQPNTDSEILGYTRKENSIQKGEKAVGGTYKVADGNESDQWVYSNVLLWGSSNCNIEEADCEEGKHKTIKNEDDSQKRVEGYFAEIGLNIREESDDINNEKTNTDSEEEGIVLASSTERVDDSETDAINSGEADNNNTENESEGDLGEGFQGDVDWVELESELAGDEESSVKKVPIRESSQHQAVVNRKMLEVLSINPDEALGKKFSATFVATSDLLEEGEEKIESEATEYTIVGITSDEESPVFYVPFMDLRSLGIVNYSQAKTIVENQNELATVRKKIEAMGFTTRSVVDTVNQINSFFQTARVVLALLGMVALSVAALGMFNTLTISLLERIREVGLMKAMGMKSSEIKELFLTESMIMGFFGGVLGIFLGFASGELFGLMLSIFTIYKGAGFIDVSHIPLVFVIFVLFLSLVVGLGTGIYPARRATKISALNALRYE